jgi:hypothetical protein
MDASRLAEIESAIKEKIDSTIDQWVSQTVKDRFISRPVGLPKMSLWDKFKRGVANWFWGPKGDKYNKHRWTNRFGDELGVSESFDPSIFTLNEYMRIREVVDSLERRLDEADEAKQSEEDVEFGKLRLMTIIKSAANDLKGMLHRAVMNAISSVPPQRAAAAPEAPKVQVTEPPTENPKTNANAATSLGPVANKGQNNKSKSSTPKSDKASSNPKKGRVKKKTSDSEAPATSPDKTEDEVAPSPEDSDSGSTPSTPRPEPSDPPTNTSQNASSDDIVDKSEADNEELRGFFYTEKDDPVNFEERIINFFNIQKYKEYKKQLVKFWRSFQSEIQKNNWSEQEARFNLYSRMVLSNKFLDDVSEITGFDRDQVKIDMAEYLATLGS